MITVVETREIAVAAIAIAARQKMIEHAAVRMSRTLPEPVIARQH